MGILRNTLDELLEDLPLSRSVKLRVVAMKAHGSCNLSDSERFITISIKSTDPLPIQEETLIHEYGHAMEMDQTGNHSKLWGECHSKAYTAWTKRHA
jgi:hypothetical protein